MERYWKKNSTKKRKLARVVFWVIKYILGNFIPVVEKINQVVFKARQVILGNILTTTELSTILGMGHTCSFSCWKNWNEGSFNYRIVGKPGQPSETLSKWG